MESQRTIPITNRRQSRVPASREIHIQHRRSRREPIILSHQGRIHRNELTAITNPHSLAIQRHRHRPIRIRNTQAVLVRQLRDLNNLARGRSLRQRFRHRILRQLRVRRRHHRDTGQDQRYT